ncbi:TDT family transporter [Arcanobacterium buesumense]|uniref:TDT family transporter n=1 Tax=Arcanobacterium buesumense TaxID=2722751 RepID=A0A6H2EIT9_9ACTO|nr:TDT family transporter [Arcanobacterium buesumense]QJC21485.1 TDT family transporter [Arcanobacterium buesumense]
MKKRAIILPPLGPAWFSSVMGTGLLANLLGRYIGDFPWLVYPASALLFIGIVLLIVLTVGYLVRLERTHTSERANVHFVPVVDPAWGTVSMGYLSVGSALLTVGPHIGLSGIVLPADTVLWSIGTVIGLVTNVAFLAHTMSRHVGTPLPVWGLAVVGPMVSATTGALLLRHFHTPGLQFMMLTLSFLCFILALTHGTIIFILAYAWHNRIEPLPVDASISSWIPLGVVGQSTAAAVAISGSASLFLAPQAQSFATTTAVIYGLVMLVIAVPVIGFAIGQTWRGYRNNMAFSPGWWALTFPIGTLALGGAMLSEVPVIAGSAVATIAGIVGWVSLLTLCGTWTFCAGGSLWAIAVHHKRQFFGAGAVPSRRQ